MDTVVSVWIDGEFGKFVRRIVCNQADMMSIDWNVPHPRIMKLEIWTVPAGTVESHTEFLDRDDDQPSSAETGEPR